MQEMLYVSGVELFAEGLELREQAGFSSSWAEKRRSRIESFMGPN